MFEGGDFITIDFTDWRKIYKRRTIISNYHINLTMLKDVGSRVLFKTICGEEVYAKYIAYRRVCQILPLLLC